MKSDSKTHIRIDNTFGKSPMFFWVKNYSISYFYYVIFYEKYKETFFDYKCYRPGKIIKFFKK